MSLSQVREENVKNWNDEDLSFYEDFFEDLPTEKQSNIIPEKVLFEKTWDNFKTFLKNEE